MNFRKKNRTYSNTKGITLISLVVTIIILLILSGVSIATLVGDNTIILKAYNAKIANELSSYKEELDLYKITKKMENSNFIESSLTAGKQNLNYNTKSESESGNIKTVIARLSDNYIDYMEIIKGELLLNTKDKNIINVAKSIGIKVNPYDIEEGVLLSSNGNLLLMDENGTLTIPDSVTAIGEGAFSNLDGLKTIIIPGTCKEIATSAFAYNSTLEKVIIEDGVEKISAYAFRYCPNLKTVQMANSVKEIGSLAFYNDPALENINLSTNLKILNSYILSNCPKLKSITLPESLEKIDAYAFSTAGLESINIPKNLVTIEGTAFNSNPSLNVITVDPENKKFAFVDGILLGENKSKIILISSNAVSGDTFVIPEGVASLSRGQLSSYKNITKIEIPSTVTSIAEGFFDANIIEVNISNDNPKYETDGKAIYTKDGEDLIRYYANDSNVTIKDGVKNITPYSIERKTAITQINFPDSLEAIYTQALSGCNNLTNIQLGPNIKKLDSMSIYGSAVESITLDENNPNYSIIDGALYNEDGTIFISPIKKTGNITSYSIPEGVTEIESYAFHNQTNMKSIILPSTLKKIGVSFNFCTSLKTIEIPSSVTSISSGCFDRCGNELNKIVINNKKGAIAGSPWGCQYGEKAIEYSEN